MATCRVKGVPVKGATCSHVKCTTNECGAPDDFRCIHRTDDPLRRYTLMVRRSNGSIGKVITWGYTLTEAVKRAGNPIIVGSKSEPWSQCGADCGDCDGCTTKGESK